jgi:hypothetical protein
MKLRQLFIPSVLLVVALSLAPAVTPALAEATAEKSATHPVVSNHLTDFKSGAYQMRKEADRLNTLGSRVSWQTHSQSLGTLTDQVNDLGKVLARMEALKTESGQTQQMAIESVRTHLVAVAQSLTQAIEMLRENRYSISQPAYADTLESLYKHSHSLYEKVDTILDYEGARTRFDNLELQPSSSQGS